VVLPDAELQIHPRVAQQGIAPESISKVLVESLRKVQPFRGKGVHSAVALLDWDHRLPSKALTLRLHVVYDQAARERFNQALDMRKNEISQKDKYPEFDVPDFDGLAADEAYEIELSPSGQVGRSRLTSAWRRTVASKDAKLAVELVQACDDYQKLVAASPSRPAYLGDLEAVSWTPPCETDHARWTLDVWYLLAFDGRIGSGRSFLADLETKQIVSVRDFSVRTG